MKTPLSFSLLLATVALIGGCAKTPPKVAETESKTPAPETTLLSPAAQQAQAPAVPAGEGIRWATNYDAALKDAKANHKLVMIDFFTDWCTWCKKLDSDTYPDPAVVAASKQFAPVKINAEKEGLKLAAKYDVRAYPRILFLDGNEQVVGSVEGYKPADEMASAMDGVIKADADYRVLKAANPSDFPSLVKLAGMDAMRMQFDEAKRYADRAERVDSNSKSDDLADAYNAIGAHFGNTDKADQALPLFQKVLKRSDDPAHILMADQNIAVCYFKLKQSAKAIPYLERASQIKGLPDSATQQLAQMMDYAKQQASKGQ